MVVCGSGPYGEPHPLRVERGGAGGRFLSWRRSRLLSNGSTAGAPSFVISAEMLLMLRGVDESPARREALCHSNKHLLSLMF
jgi:hypothetical protein